MFISDGKRLQIFINEHNFKNLKIRRMNYFNKKLHLHNPNGCINQVSNRDITQGFGFHIRYGK